MPLQFDRPVGAPADCNELEYCAALLQTCSGTLRLDATVQAIDVARLLTSRHGLRLPVNQIRDAVLVQLAGSILNDDDFEDTNSNADDINKEEEDEVDEVLEDAEERNANTGTNEEEEDEEVQTTMDLVQLTALLFIPELLRIRQENCHPEQKQQRPTMNTTSMMSGHYFDDESLSSFSLQEDDNDDKDEEEDGRSCDSQLSLIQVVLNFMLENAGVEPGSVLTVDVLQTVLAAYGEEWPDNILQEMVDCCSRESSATSALGNSMNATQLPMLTADTFLHALTYDTAERYPLYRESLESTHYQDALAGPIDKNSGGIPLKRIYTAPSIDNTADTYRCFWWSILAWITLAATFVSYFLDGLELHQTLPTVDCYDETTGTSTSFGCEIVNGIVTWLEIFVELSVLGSSFMFLSTLGNSVYALSTSKVMGKWMAVGANCVGLVVVTFCTILAFSYDVDTPFFSTEKDDSTTYYWSLVLGCLLLVVILAQLIKLLFPLDYYPRLRPYFASGALKMERWTKLSARYKTQKMIANALDCHFADDDDDAGINCDLEDKPDTDDNYDRTTEDGRKGSTSTLSHFGSAFLKGKSRHGPMSESLLKFHAQSSCTESVGGICWFWRGLLYNRTLLKEQGIWLFPRLIYSNLAQWFVSLLIPVFLGFGARWVQNHESDLTSYSIKKGEVYVALIVGSALALAASLGIALIYIPSGTSTVLRFRSGFLPSLRDRRFLVYRTAPDNTTILFGSAFWGIIFTSVVCWIVAGVVTFLLVWEAIRDAILIIVANIIGFLVTIALKLMILCFVRVRWYGGFYRRNPAGANTSNLVLECWNLGLSTGYIIARISRILVVTAFYIGRIDTPLLAPGVGWLLGKIPADAYPISFRKDLLIHEAHRHPYIERLSFLSMLKLRHGSRFGGQAGAAWRILFVLGLMPWMRKYRCRPKRKLDPLSPSTHSSATYVVSDLWTQKHALELQVQQLERENEALRNMADRRVRSTRSIKKQSSGRQRQSWFQEQSKRVLAKRSSKKLAI